jgi:hypothetical protein
MQIIAVDVSFCLRELLPGMFSKRIKADASLTGIRQHDTHLGCAIIVRAKNDIELAHRKTVHVILGSPSSSTLRIPASLSFVESTRLRSHRADLGMITTNNVSTFTILQFNTIALLLTLSCNRVRWACIASGVILPTRPILQLTVPGSKGHRTHTSIPRRIFRSAPPDSG